MDFSNEMIAIIVGVAATVGASMSEIIKAIKDRLVRNISKAGRRIKLDTHPFFVYVPIYIRQELPSIHFNHETRKNLVIDYLQVRWDYMLFTLNDEIKNFDFNSLSPEKFILTHSSNFIKMEEDIQKILIERGFPEEIYNKFKQSQKFVDIFCIAVFVTIFRNNKVMENNMQKFYMFLDILLEIHEESKKHAILALADLNGELNNYVYKIQPYKFRYNG